MSYVVRPAALEPPGGPEPGLLRLWSENLPERCDPREKLRWAYLESPAGRGEVFVLEDGGGSGASAVVGCAGVSARAFSTGGGSVTAALHADLAVERGHRTFFPGLRLATAARDHALSRSDFAYGFPSPPAVGAFRRLGYSTLGTMVRHAHVLRAEDYLRRHLPELHLASFPAAVANGLASALDGFRARRAREAFRLARAADFDARFDALWDRARSRLPLTAWRSQAFLRWRFLGRPGRTFEIDTLLDARQGRLSGYAIVEREGALAHVRDLLAESAAAEDALLALLPPALREEDAAVVSVSFLGLRTFAARLAAHGFHPRPSERVVMVLSATPGDLDPESWFLMDVDEDV